MSTARCLRCGAGSEWLEGEVKGRCGEPTTDIEIKDYAKSLEQTLGRVCELADKILPCVEWAMLKSNSQQSELYAAWKELRDYIMQVRP